MADHPIRTFDLAQDLSWMPFLTQLSDFNPGLEPALSMSWLGLAVGYEPTQQERSLLLSHQRLQLTY